MDIVQIPEAQIAQGIKQAAALLDAGKKQSLAIAPWAAFPYKPTVNFSIAHYQHGIALKFYVEEASIRAANTNINGSIWEDSCVEFFLQFEGDAGYYNLEFNCTGTGLTGYGPSKKERALLPAHIVQQIKAMALIYSSEENMRRWELTLLIPVSVFIHSNLKLLTGVSCKANFYKCGDLLPQPHFLVWAPVNTPAPNFHVPESFIKISFL
ncbi:MAG: carbohydrate-binding family 9-like protein [Chitinophagaceae bacterium]